jgi:adenylate kinase family enzyme
MILINHYRDCIIEGYDLQEFKQHLNYIIGIDYPDEILLDRLVIREPHTDIETLKNRIRNQKLNMNICDIIIERIVK